MASPSNESQLEIERLRQRVQELESRGRFCDRFKTDGRPDRSCFPEILVRLHEITLEISTIHVFDELSLRVIELGIEKLGYSRLGLWYLEDEDLLARGTFGVDENGEIRDERASRVKVKEDNMTGNVLRRKLRFAVEKDIELFNDHLHIIGRGDRCTAAIWNGQQVIGFLSADNLLMDRELSEQDGELLAQYAAVIGHLTSRLLTQETLRKSEATLQSILRAAPIGIGLVTNRVLGWANDEILRMLGYTREELMGQSARILYGTDEEYLRIGKEKCRNVTENGVGSIRTRWVRKDGSTFDVLLSSAAIEAERLSSGLVYSAIDLTQQIEEEKAREEMELRLQESQKLESLGVLAGGIAHDFNNLLMGVLGNADLALRESSAGSNIRDYLTSIESAAQQAADLCTQMLAYAGKGRFIVEKIDLNQQIRGMSQMLEVSTGKKARIILNLDKSQPGTSADASCLRQVLLNLVTNSAEAMVKHTGTITISTGVEDLDGSALRKMLLGKERKPGRYAFVEIRDDGSGMSDEVLSHAFEPFYTTKFAGRGLGLSAVLGIVRSHEGALRARTQSGKGTSIRLYLPMADITKEAVENEIEDVGDWTGTGHILLVDDEAPVRRIIRRMLERLGFEVTEAEDGKEALDIYRKNARFDCVMLDLLMPVMDGEVTRSAIHTIEPKQRIIISSGYTEGEISERFAGIPIAGFVQKPYKLDALRRTLRSIFE